MKLDVSKIDLAELNKAWAAGVRDKFDASAKALREAARDFAGFKKGFGDDDKQGFYSRMLKPKSPLNVALLDSVQALADCAGDFAIKRNRRIVATFKGIVSEALEPLRHGVIACCMPPPPGCDDDTWNVFRQWQVKTFDAIGAMQNAIEDTADAETEVEDGIAYEITPGLHAETLRYDIECGLAEMSKRIRKVRASACGEDVDDAPRMYGRLEAMFAALCGGNADMLAMMKEIGGKVDAARDTIREDIANTGDDLFAAMGEKRKPPTPNELDDSTENEINAKLSAVLKSTARRKREERDEAIERFLDQSQIRFKGYTLREIFKDVDAVERFLNKMRMRKVDRRKRK